MSVDRVPSRNNKASQPLAAEEASRELLAKSVLDLLEHSSVKLEHLVQQVRLAGALDSVTERAVQLANEIFQHIVEEESGGSASDPAINPYTLMEVVSRELRQQAPFQRAGKPNFELQARLLVDLGSSITPIASSKDVLARWLVDSPAWHSAKQLLKTADEIAQLRARIEGLQHLEVTSATFRSFEVFDSLWHLPGVDKAELLQRLLAVEDGNAERSLCDFVQLYNQALISDDGCFNAAVQQILQDDDDTLAQLNMPIECHNASEHERLAAMQAAKSNYREQWRRLTGRIATNMLAEGFNSDEEHSRAYFFFQNLSSLYQVWQLHAKTCPWMLLDDIAEFVETCETGWNERIIDLLQRAWEASGAEAAISNFDKPLVSACWGRRKKLDQAVTDVHYRLAAKQMLNDSAALGYTERELGNAETEANQQIVHAYYSAAIEEALLSVSAGDYLQSAKAQCDLMGEAGRLRVIETLVERYSESFPGKSSLLAPQDVKQLLSDSALLQSLLNKRAITSSSAWERKLRECFYSPQSGRYLLPEGLLRPPQPGENLAQWRSSMLQQLQQIVQLADAHAFREVIAKDSQLSTLGLQLWLGALGLVTYHEPEFRQYMQRLCPAYASMHEHLKQSVLAQLSNQAKHHRNYATSALPMQQVVPGQLLMDKEWVLQAIEIYPGLVRRLDASLHKDPEVLTVLRRVFKKLVRQVSQQKSLFDVARVIADIPPNLLRNGKWMLQVVPMLPEILARAPPKIRCDRELMAAALASSSQAIVYADEQLLHDGSFMMEAITKYGVSLQHASAELRDNPELVEAAIRSAGSNFQYASERLRRSQALLLLSIADCPSMMDYAPADLCHDQQFMQSALVRNLAVLEYLPSELLDDEQFMCATVKLMLATADARAADNSYLFSRIAMFWPQFVSMAPQLLDGGVRWPIAAPIDCLALARRPDCGAFALYLLDKRQPVHREFVLKRLPDIIDMILATHVPLFRGGNRADTFTMQHLTQFLHGFLSPEELQAICDDPQIFSTVFYRFAQVMHGSVADVPVDVARYQESFIANFDELLLMMSRRLRAQPQLMIQVAAVIAYHDELVSKMLAQISGELINKIIPLLVSLHGRNIQKCADIMTPELALLCSSLNPAIVELLPPQILQNFTGEAWATAQQLGYESTLKVPQRLPVLSSDKVLPLLRRMVELHMLSPDDIQL